MSILVIGDVIRHQWYSTNGDMRWEAEVVSINEDDNELKVSVMGIYGQSHPENWNLAHTVSGLNMGEYTKRSSKDHAKDPLIGKNKD